MVFYVDQLVCDFHAEWAHWVTLVEGVEPDFFVEVVSDTLVLAGFEIHDFFGLFLIILL